MRADRHVLLIFVLFPSSRPVRNKLPVPGNYFNFLENPFNFPQFITKHFDLVEQGGGSSDVIRDRQLNRCVVQQQ